MDLSTEWKIGRGNKTCSKCSVSFEQGDEYFSVLYDLKTEFVRNDFCPSCWADQQQEEVFSFWKTRIPKDEKERVKIDESMLLNFFHRLEGAEDRTKRNFRYVLSLLLMRRRILKFQDVTKGEAGEAMILRDPKEDAIHEVVNPQLSEDEINQVTEELGQMLSINVQNAGHDSDVAEDDKISQEDNAQARSSE